MTSQDTLKYRIPPREVRSFLLVPTWLLREDAIHCSTQVRVHRRPHNISTRAATTTIAYHIYNIVLNNNTTPIIMSSESGGSGQISYTINWVAKITQLISNKVKKRYWSWQGARGAQGNLNCM